MKLEDAYLRELLARLDSAEDKSSLLADNSIEDVVEDVPKADATSQSSPAGDDAPIASGHCNIDPQRVEAALERRLALLCKHIADMSECEVPREVALPALLAEAPLIEQSVKGMASAGVASAANNAQSRSSPMGEFCPLIPTSLAELGISQEEIEPLALKYLLNRGACSGRQIAGQLGIPFSLTENVLQELKTVQLVVYKGAAPVGDHVYQLTSSGMEKARQAFKHCGYFGTVPVPLETYNASIERQSIRRIRPGAEEIDAIFRDLLVSDTVRQQVGQALYSGNGFFLYGAPGNGKTSIAERVARAFGQYVWIPRALYIAGEIVRLFDPCNHVEAPLDMATETPPGPLDRRWVRIHRPTVITGGELTMDRLEITVHRSTGINEAPLQLKSNCGVLVIDDFGRQRISVAELLNRWIVPLDRHYDFLQLPGGKTVQVPFDQLLVFSTNLEPRDLVDEAFLRRIAYKIEVGDPSLNEFRRLLAREAERVGCVMDESAVEHLIKKHYVTPRRAVRACHARDLLKQVQDYCGFRQLPLAVSVDAFDTAARNYFGLMQGVRA